MAKTRRRKVAPTIVLDLAAIIGWALIGYGLHLAYHPLGFIWAGGVLFFGGVFASYIRGRRK